MKDLQYADAVFSETLRLYPSGTRILLETFAFLSCSLSLRFPARAVPNDSKIACRDTVLGGVKIPAGTVIGAPFISPRLVDPSLACAVLVLTGYAPYTLGRLESIWGPDAESFRPERWSVSYMRFLRAHLCCFYLAGWSSLRSRASRFATACRSSSSCNSTPARASASVGRGPSFGVTLTHSSPFARAGKDLAYFEAKVLTCHLLRRFNIRALPGFKPDFRMTVQQLYSALSPAEPCVIVRVT